MNCITPEILAEIAAAAANGETTAPQYAEAHAHLEDCAACRQSYEAHRDTAVQMRQALALGRGQRHAGGGCKDDESFAAYLDRTINTDERNEFEAHLARCGHCFEQLLELTEMMERTAEARPGTLRYVVGAAAERLRFLSHPEDGSFSMPELQPAPVLGPNGADRQHAGGACAWKQRANDLELSFLAVPAGADHVNLSVQVTREAPPPEGARLSLWAGGRLIQSEALPGSGGLELPGLDLRGYEAEIELADGTIIPFDIEIFSEDSERDS